MKLDQVSIVIVTYKGDEVLSNCLESLALTCGEEPQIVVVDNSPSKSTKGLVERYSNAIYVESPGNPGFAGGNNRAMPFCDRKYVLLLNNDTVVRSRSSIEILVDYIESHPECWVVQGSIILPNANGLAGGCGSFLTPFGFQYARGFAVPLCGLARGQSIRRVMLSNLMTAGVCCLRWRDACMRIMRIMRIMRRVLGASCYTPRVCLPLCGVARAKSIRWGDYCSSAPQIKPQYSQYSQYS